MYSYINENRTIYQHYLGKFNTDYPKIAAITSS